MTTTRTRTAAKKAEATPTKGKVAVITGASRGIGKATAIELAKRGFDVAICARSVNEKDVSPWPGTIHETADLVRKQGRRALPIQADLTKMEDVHKVVNATMKEFGRIDLMMNNSRYVSDGHWTRLTETKWEDLNNMVEVNTRAPLLFHWLVVPIMIKQGGGVIINITTSAATTDSPYLPGKGSTGIGYPVTKAAFNRIASALAKEVREYNIAVINLSPGFTMTERVEVETATFGFDVTQAHSVWVPAKAVAHMATCANPLAFSGNYYESKEFVKQFGLMTEAELASPYKGKKVEGWVSPSKKVG